MSSVKVCFLHQDALGSGDKHLSVWFQLAQRRAIQVWGFLVSIFYLVGREPVPTFIVHKTMGQLNNIKIRYLLQKHFSETSSCEVDLSDCLQEGYWK